MAASPYSAAFPSGPLLDPTTQTLTTAWRAFFISLYSRTGSSAGGTISGLQSAIDAETTARAAEDTALEGDIAAEATTRANADTTEKAARTAADAALQASKLAKAGDTMTGGLAGTTAVFASLQTGGGGGPTWTAGAGVPTAAAPIGSLYSNTTGALGARLYVSAGGGTWTAIPGV